MTTTYAQTTTVLQVTLWEKGLEHEALQAIRAAAEEVLGPERIANIEVFVRPGELED